MKFLVAILVLIFAVAVYKTNGLCNTCSVSGVACVAQNKFKFCKDGTPSETIYDCPPGFFCSAEEQVCSSTVATSCLRCKTCDSTNTFSCTKNNAFSLCYENGTINTNIEYICPKNLVCNVDSVRMCVNETASGIGATCGVDEIATTLPPPTTPNAILHPVEFCTNKGKAGNYEVSADNTCRQFINCVYTGSSWKGNLYLCPSNLYFNQTTNSCGTGMPSRCL